MAEKQFHILYTVLDWGLGHATRSIPVIRQLLDRGIRVSIAGEGDSIFLLRSTFPQCNFYTLNGLQVNYPSNGLMILSMLWNSPRFLYMIHKEHRQTTALIKQIHPDAIISDSRFGAWSKKIPAVIISHQLRIKAPKGFKILEPFIYLLNRHYIRRFKFLWTPDAPGESNITGDLAHHPKLLRQLNPVFIGPLSRFLNLKSADIRQRYEVLFVLSGPEPQRSIFENECIKQAHDLNLKTLIVRGRPQEKEVVHEKNITMEPHLPAAELKAHMEQSTYIVSRSGHSTLMDLSYLSKSALCIPTPGQTEQEYLGELLAKRGQIICQNQKNFNLKEGISLLKGCNPIARVEKDLLSIEIDRFIKFLKTLG